MKTAANTKREQWSKVIMSEVNLTDSWKYEMFLVIDETLIHYPTQLFQREI